MADKTRRFDRKTVYFEEVTDQDREDLARVLNKLGTKWVDRKTGDSLQIRFGEIHPDIQLRVVEYGVPKWYEDRTSGVPAEEKLAAREDHHTFAEAGTWAKPKGGGIRTVSAKVEALAAIYGISVGAAQEKLRDYTAEERAKILGSDAVKEKAREILEAREETSEESGTFDNLLED